MLQEEAQPLRGSFSHPGGKEANHTAVGRGGSEREKAPVGQPPSDPGRLRTAHAGEVARFGHDESGPFQGKHEDPALGQSEPGRFVDSLLIAIQVGVKLAKPAAGEVHPEGHAPMLGE